MALQKVPPPPPIANQDPTFNRWLLELTNILNNDGTIDGGTIDGFGALQTTVSNHTMQINLLNSGVSLLNSQVLTLQGQVTTLQGQVVALQARNQVYNGSGVPAPGLGIVGDWYGNTGGAVGARIYVKTAVATWTAFPF